MGELVLGEDVGEAVERLRSRSALDVGTVVHAQRALISGGPAVVISEGTLEEDLVTSGAASPLWTPVRDAVINDGAGLVLLESAGRLLVMPDRLHESGSSIELIGRPLRVPLPPRGIAEEWSL
jgi:hypothetical protein